MFIAALLFASPAAGGETKPPIRLATTTSTDHSGLLENILPQFTRATGYQVQVIAVGTGKALRLGEAGDVDALLVHDPRREQLFINQGHGVLHQRVMRNDFVFVGPAEDPADLSAAISVSDALHRLHRAQIKFISRGDESGTHQKELSLWRRAGLDADKKWRLETGQGMSKTLQIADQLQAYTLTDRGTWLFLKNNISLRLVYQNKTELQNPYGLLAVNPARHKVNYAGARALINWLASARGQNAIGAYKIGGMQLFIPAHQ